SRSSRCAEQRSHITSRPKRRRAEGTTSGGSGRLPGVSWSALLGGALAKDEPEPRIPDGREEKAADSDGKDQKPMNEESIAEDSGEIGEPRRVTQHAKGARKKPGAQSEPAHRDHPDTDGSVRENPVGDVQSQASHHLNRLLKRRLSVRVMGDDPAVECDFHEVAPGEDSEAIEGRRC